jgi:hypothetical protein
VEADEVLPEPRRSRLLRTAARRRALGSLAAVVLAGAISTRIATADNREAHPTPSPTRSLLAGPPLAPAKAESLFPYDPTVCPNELPCGVTDVVPPAVLVALSEHAPGIKTLRLHTVGVFAHQPIRNGLWFRQIDAKIGAVRVQVIVKKASPDAASAPTDSSERFDGTSIGFVRVNIASFAVSVEYTGPADYSPPMAQIRALAGDQRLLRLS